MSVTPQDLWKHSQQLFSGATDEAQLRNTISRAYYSAYHACLCFHSALPSGGSEPARKIGVHGTLVHQLGNPIFDKSDARHSLSRLLSVKLTGFHAQRVTADYALEDPIERADAADALIKASAIFRLLEET